MSLKNSYDARTNSSTLKVMVPIKHLSHGNGSPLADRLYSAHTVHKSNHCPPKSSHLRMSMCHMSPHDSGIMPPALYLFGYPLWLFSPPLGTFKLLRMCFTSQSEDTLQGTAVNSRQLPVHDSGKITSHHSSAGFPH